LSKYNISGTWASSIITA